MSHRFCLIQRTYSCIESILIQIWCCPYMAVTLIERGNLLPFLCESHDSRHNVLLGIDISSHIFLFAAPDLPSNWSSNFFYRIMSKKMKIRKYWYHGTNLILGGWNFVDNLACRAKIISVSWDVPLNSWTLRIIILSSPTDKSVGPFDVIPYVRSR